MWRPASFPRRCYSQRPNPHTQATSSQLSEAPSLQEVFHERLKPERSEFVACWDFRPARSTAAREKESQEWKSFFPVDSMGPEPKKPKVPEAADDGDAWEFEYEAEEMEALKNRDWHS